LTYPAAAPKCSATLRCIYITHGRVPHYLGPRISFIARAAAFNRRYRAGREPLTVIRCLGPSIG